MKRLPVEDLEHIYQNTQDVWESFRGKSIFLTGGTGFFGKWLLESFIYLNEKLDLNAKITTLTRNPESFLNDFPFYNDYRNTICFVKGDILSYDFNLEEKFQFIIHAATAASESLNNSNPLLMMDTITIGTRRVLEFALRNPIEGFLFVSSGAIYGKQPWNVSHVKESDCFKIDINSAKSAYAEGKRIAELYCSTYFEQQKLPIKIARCFAFVGPYLPLDTHFAIGNFINNALLNEDIIIKGDGKALRSYLYSADLMIWLWTIIIKGKNNTPYNVGSDNPIELKELALMIASELKGNMKVEIQNAILSKIEDRYIPDVEKSKSLNLIQKISLYDSIMRTLKFYKQY
jgi:nucleoside-diphosphate-sugar epimerase